MPNPAEEIRRTQAGSLGVPLLTGALLEEPSSPPQTFNSALILDRNADVRGRYDKQYRLPFGEYLPFGERFPILYRLSPASARIAAGERTGPLPFEDKRITTIICYEDILPRYVGDLVHRHRPHLIVNLTNDGWFGESVEPDIHLALSKFRAVETPSFPSTCNEHGSVGARGPSRSGGSQCATVRSSNPDRSCTVAAWLDALWAVGRQPLVRDHSDGRHGRVVEATHISF